MNWRLTIPIFILLVCVLGLYLYYPHIMSSSEKCDILRTEVWCENNQTASEEWNKSCNFGMITLSLFPAFILIGLIGICIATIASTIKSALRTDC